MHFSRLALVVGLIVLPVFASAHVTVRPSEVGVASYQTFNVSVPTEKEIPTVGVRLVIPEGLESVRPNVKPGWTIEVVKTGEGDTARISEIVWTGGSVPADQRDDFFFSAKTPAAPTTLRWNAYQTYEDGSVVAWDSEEEHTEAAPASHTEEEEEKEERGPFSETTVIDDLANADKKHIDRPVEEMTMTPVTYRPAIWWDCWIILSLVMSGTALLLALKNHRHGSDNG